MTATRGRTLVIGLALAAILVVLARPAAVAQRSDDPLPSWNEGAAKQQIVAFVVFQPLAARAAHRQVQTEPAAPATSPS